MAKVYESYMVKGCYELAKFDTAVTMMSEASNGHMHEVGKDLAKIKTPKEWDSATGKEHDLSTDEGFSSFIENAQANCGTDNTLQMIDHLGQNDRVMNLEMKNSVDLML